jgi:6-phosphogluconolactonase
MEPEIIIVQDLQELSTVAADRFARLAAGAVAAHGRFSAALSGGGTPQGMYRRLAEAHGPGSGQPIPWRQVHLFWGDERAVPPTDPENNFGQAWQAFIKHVPIPSGQVHRIRTDLAPEAAAHIYAAELEAFFGSAWPEFDLVLLGMGEDGHVAALFPGSPALAERTQPVTVSTAEYQGRPAQRVTLTLPAINAARHVLLLVSGAAKAPTVRAVIDRSSDHLPAQQVCPSHGRLTWVLDQDAASEIRY